MVTVAVTVTVMVYLTAFYYFTILVQNGWGTVKERSAFFGMALERRGNNGNGTGTVHRNERITVTLFRWKTKYSNAF